MKDDGRKDRDTRKQGGRKPARRSVSYGEPFDPGLLDVVPTPIAIINPDTSIRYVNPALENITGFSSAELLGRKAPYPWWTKESPQWTGADFARAMQEPVRGLEHMLQRKDGECFWVEITTVLVRRDGEPEYYLLDWLDITERRQAEEKVNHLNLVLRAIRNVNQLITKERDRDRLLQGACDNLIETRGYHNAWIALLDGSGQLVTAAEAGLGEGFLLLLERLKQGNLTACGLRALAQPEVVVIEDPPSQCADCPLAERYSNRGAVTVRLEHEGRVYGMMSVSVPAALAADEEEQALFREVAGDIAFALHNMEMEKARQRAEEELKGYSENLEQLVEERTRELQDAQEELVRHERLAVLGQLAGGVSHELRNPLAVISNAVYFLQMTLPDADEKTGDYLKLISSEVRNAERIVSDLLDFSRTRVPDREKVAVSDLVAGVLEKQPPPQEVMLNTSLPSDLPPVFVDPRGIGQVLANLVSNAYQAMPQGGDLTISARAEPGRVALSVSDTGCGIPEENLAKVFEPLFTTRARGIGLGLAVSRNLAQANGGSLEVHSEEGRGSTFTLTLPVTGGVGD